MENMEDEEIYHDVKETNSKKAHRWSIEYKQKYCDLYQWADSSNIPQTIKTVGILINMDPKIPMSPLIVYLSSFPMFQIHSIQIRHDPVAI